MMTPTAPCLPFALSAPVLTAAASCTGAEAAQARVIAQTLAAFKVYAEIGDVQVGPTVTQFALRPAPGVRISRITSLAPELALALEVPGVRVVPATGGARLVVEVPHPTSATVRLADLLAGRAFSDSEAQLPLALGVDAVGQPLIADLATLPHLLIAGATGSGKSVLLHTIIASLVARHGPDSLRLVCVDTKAVELRAWGALPHLLTPVVTAAHTTGALLRWLLREMDRRYKLLSDAAVADRASYNARQRDPAAQLPALVLVVDELADLLIQNRAEVEGTLNRLAAVGRAAGIHLVLATQRPSVDVLPGTIKANFPARLACAVSSAIDSRIILDRAGAEKLLGRGDLLFRPSDGNAPQRGQGAYLAPDEIAALVRFWTTTVPQAPAQIPAQELGLTVDNGPDPLLPIATALVRAEGRADATYLSDRLGIRLGHAIQILLQMVEQGVLREDMPFRYTVLAPDGQPIARKSAITWVSINGHTFAQL